MTFIDDLIPKFYELLGLRIHREDTDVILIADMKILNAQGTHLVDHSPITTLTPQEKQALRNFVSRELAAFETATGLTEWIPPEEP